MDKAGLLQPWRMLAHWLLPPRCLLCGAAGTDGADLCAACADGARVHWRVDVQAVIGNIDLVVLERAR